MYTDTHSFRGNGSNAKTTQTATFTYSVHNGNMKCRILYLY